MNWIHLAALRLKPRQHCIDLMRLQSDEDKIVWNLFIQQVGYLQLCVLLFGIKDASRHASAALTA